MDILVEQLIAQKKTPAQIALIVLTVVAAILISFALFVFLSFFALILIAALCYGAWWLISSQNREYEYCITNTCVDVDCVIARRRRQRVVSVSPEKITAAGAYRSAEWQGRKVDRTVMAASSLNAPGLCYFAYHSKKRGNTLVIFEPDDRVREAMGQCLPRTLAMDWNKL